MSTTKSATIHVPGATLSYRQHGPGPLLVLLPGGDGDIDITEGLVDHLVDRYGVLTYDRRGLSRSTIGAAQAASHTLTTHADDLHHLLAALTRESVFVAGSSIGALIGLELVARHPEQVHVLVAHEPPIFQLLPDAARDAALRTQQDIEHTFEREGAAAAMAKFVPFAGVDLQDREPGVMVPPPPTPQRAANLRFFFTHDSPAVRVHRLDLSALRAASTRIVPAAGRSFPDSMPHRCAQVLAQQLGTALVEFPGGHTGWLLRPQEFARKLTDVLG